MNHTIVIENYSTVHLRGHFNIPDISMSPLFMDELSEGIFGDAMAKYDNILTEEIRNHLNESLGVSHSGNINRTRAIISRGFYTFYHIFEESFFVLLPSTAIQKLSNLFTFCDAKLIKFVYLHDAKIINFVYLYDARIIRFVYIYDEKIIKFVYFSIILLLFLTPLTSM